MFLRVTKLLRKKVGLTNTKKSWIFFLVSKNQVEKSDRIVTFDWEFRLRRKNWWRIDLFQQISMFLKGIQVVLCSLFSFFLVRSHCLFICRPLTKRRRESNPGWLGVKRKRFLCAVPSHQAKILRYFRKKIKNTLIVRRIVHLIWNNAAWHIIALRGIFCYDVPLLRDAACA